MLEIYTDGIIYGVTTGLIFMSIFLIVGIIRYIKRYAYAIPLSEDNDDATDSSFMCRALWCLDDFIHCSSIREDEQIQKPIGADWQGTGIDIFLSGVFFIVFGFLWPVIIPCLILWIPVQIMHNYHIRKKEFVAKLHDRAIV